MSRPELEAKLKEIRDHNVVNGESIGIEVKTIDHIDDMQTQISNDIKFIIHSIINKFDLCSNLKIFLSVTVAILRSHEFTMSRTPPLEFSH